MGHVSVTLPPDIKQKRRFSYTLRLLFYCIFNFGSPKSEIGARLFSTAVPLRLLGRQVVYKDVII